MIFDFYLLGILIRAQYLWQKITLYPFQKQRFFDPELIYLVICLHYDEYLFEELSRRILFEL